MQHTRSTSLSILIATAIVSIVVTSTSARAQFSLPGGLGGAASGLGGGALPGLGSASAGNVTGLLGYCVKNKLVSQTGAGSDVLAKLQGRPETVQSPDYKVGLAGNLLGGKSAETGRAGTTGMLGGLTGSANKPLSLDSLPAGVRTKACDTVLSHAKTLL
ncbi:DUF2501 domain-containing protein (plasmid) [Polymorphobacter sp. PAMC 29334]|uniref:DUF2501 domain-containing protein n=1 Tax=Polymorphobacter sp. PAMC 29334 TaxID=2862331 RepID=UPI001C74F31D|nr:DUF2501 domain-containing protein [Polymorphobacter sp. PAMC 29334]QYE33433.1 DUF2501 domain-containing protein [Polymorphobacter sp. PAMC 29334]